VSVFDHVTLRVSDLQASGRFYETALAPLGVGKPSVGGQFDEWGDLSISAAGDDRKLTRRAHVALAADSEDQVDAFWRAATDAGFRDNGPPGLRPEYHERYYGAFVLDPDGNNIEAVHHGRERSSGELDHVAIRVADVGESKRFYTTVLEPLGFGVLHEADAIAGFGAPGNSLWLIQGEPSANVHIAFSAADNDTVDEWHRLALDAGYRDNGPPGERAEYHPGYYGAFVLDPDGNNVEAVCHNRD
jgi:catechol 2,3-dioxygenase-like lactoylglutathione lyase family enzyme